MARILIITPSLKLLGGVALFFKGLKPYFSREVSYLEMSPLKRNNPFAYFFYSFSNCFRFFKEVVVSKPSVVVFNSSIKPGFYSNILYCRLLNVFHKKYIVFIHGWDENYEKYLKTKIGQVYLQKAEAIIVLSVLFKKRLNQYGFDADKVFLSTTEVDDCLIKDFDINKRNGKIKNFLFLARVVRGKGLFESLETFKMLAQDYSNIKYDIVGDGEDLEEAKQYVDKHQIERVYFHGRKQGEEIIKFYNEADFFFFLSYTEGMPASLLEAMAFGLMIATRPVGAIPEVFHDGTNGILSSQLDPSYYYSQIKQYMENPELVKEIQRNNHIIAKESFLASKVASNLESILNNYATA